MTANTNDGSDEESREDWLDLLEAGDADLLPVTDEAGSIAPDVISLRPFSQSSRLERRRRRFYRLLRSRRRTDSMVRTESEGASMNWMNAVRLSPLILLVGLTVAGTVAAVMLGVKLLLSPDAGVLWGLGLIAMGVLPYLKAVNGGQHAG